LEEWQSIELVGRTEKRKGDCKEVYKRCGAAASPHPSNILDIINTTTQVHENSHTFSKIQGCFLTGSAKLNNGFGWP
jgi:hypothetical protein